MLDKIVLKIEQDFSRGSFAAKAWGDIKRCRYNFDFFETQKILKIRNYILVQVHDGGKIINCTSDTCMNRKGSCSCEEIKCHEMSITKAVIISETDAQKYILEIIKV